MFCEKCGAELKENAVFCEKCGARVAQAEQEVPQTRTEQTSQEGEKTAAPGPSPRQSKPLDKKFLFIGGGVAVVLIILIAVLVGRKPTVDLNPYVSVEYTGYDSYGKATVTFDEEAFYEEYEGKIKFSNAAKREINESFGSVADLFGADGEDINLDDYAAQFLLSECVGGDLDRSEDLTNGDEITYVWNCDEETVEAELNCRLKYEDISFTVSGLEEIETVDPFTDIEISYTGVAPLGSVSVTNHSSDEMISRLNFEATPNTGLSNGSVITVSVSLASLTGDDLIEYCTSNYGKAPSTLEKEYTVEGLGTYVSALDEIPEDTMDKMKSQTEDAIQAYVAQRWDPYRHLEGVTYIGSYFLNKKDYTNSWFGSNGYNMIDMVYRLDVAEVNDDLGVEHHFSYYYTCRFYDLILLPDGTCSVDLSDYDTCDEYFKRDVEWYISISGNKVDRPGSYTYIGYENIDTMFSDCVTSEIEDYTYESTVEDTEPAAAEESAEGDGAEDDSEADESAETDADDVEIVE